MSIDELEAEALRLEPQARARLAGRLLDSLESLSPEENEQIWLEEAERAGGRAADTSASRRPVR